MIWYEHIKYSKRGPLDYFDTLKILSQMGLNLMIYGLSNNIFIYRSHSDLKRHFESYRVSK